MSYLDHYRAKPAPQPDPEPEPRPRAIDIDGRRVHLTGAQVREWEKEKTRAAAEVRARADAQRQQEAQEQAARAAAHQERVAAEVDAELRREARASFPGSDSEFDAAWPTLKPQVQQAKALAELGRRQQEAIQRMRAQF